MVLRAGHELSLEQPESYSCPAFDLRAAALLNPHWKGFVQVAFRFYHLADVHVHVVLVFANCARPAFAAFVWLSVHFVSHVLRESYIEINTECIHAFFVGGIDVPRSKEHLNNVSS